MVLAMKWLKWYLCTIVFNDVGGASISIKLFPGMYLSYQQAYNWLIDWVNESLLHKTTSISYDSIILYVLLPTICVNFLANVVPSKRSESLIHCLLVTVYVWYFIQRKCKRLLLSVNRAVARLQNKTRQVSSAEHMPHSFIHSFISCPQKILKSRSREMLF